MRRVILSFLLLNDWVADSRKLPPLRDLRRVCHTCLASLSGLVCPCRPVFSMRMSSGRQPVAGHAPFSWL